MKIIFMGTPDFAVHFLKHLSNSSHEILAVVTQPDRPSGRGRALTFPPVKAEALELGLPVLQPDSVRDPNFAETLREFQADIFVVVAFSILPPQVLNTSKWGAVNIHGSLLPRYRGAAPVQWAIANGDKESGVTVFLLDEKMDHGPILEQRKVPIENSDTTESLLYKMIVPGCNALDAALNALETGQIHSLEQNHAASSSARKLKKEDGLIFWTQSALQIHNRIRAFTPWPGGFTTLNQKKVYLRKTDALKESFSLQPGEILLRDREMFVGTGEGTLKIMEIQVEGKRSMLVDDFLKGVHQKEKLWFVNPT